MLHPSEWQDYRLLLTVRSRNSTYSFLLKFVSQLEFFEHWCGMWGDDRDRRITEMSLTMLSEEVHDLLEPLYTGNYVLEG